jgi:hypothetical protein
MLRIPPMSDIALPAAAASDDAAMLGIAQAKPDSVSTRASIITPVSSATTRR